MHARSDGAMLLLLLGGAAGYMVPTAQPARPRAAAAVGRLAHAPRLADSQGVVIPASLPTFGLSEREQIRFRHMILHEEPLPHEVFGLQVLFGAIGTHIAGLIGCIMGTFQIAPCLSWVPGHFGDALRTVGWQAFALLRAVARATSAVWRVSGLRATFSALFAGCSTFNRETRLSHRAGSVFMNVIRLAMHALATLLGGMATAGGAVARGVGGAGAAARRTAGGVAFSPPAAGESSPSQRAEE